MVIHDTEEKKFKLEFPEGTARMEYEESADAVTVLHTNVPEALAGRGLAAELAEAAAAYARETNKDILSECSYMTAWLKRHPDAAAR